MESFATIFTSREIASILWLCLALIVFVLHPECRLQLFNLMKAIFHRNLIILYGLLFGNLLCVICLFKWISYWEISFLYDAAMWFLFTAIGLLLRLKDVRNNIFLSLIESEFTALLLVEFLLGLYSYSFVFELLALPIAVGIYVVIAFARNQKIAIYAGTLMGAYVLINVVYNIYTAISNNELIYFMGSCYQFILPLAYTIFSIPFFFMVYVYIQYEKIYVLLAHFCVRLTKKDIRRILLFCLRYCGIDPIKIKTLKKIIHKWSTVEDADICMLDIKQQIDDDERLDEQSRQPSMTLSLFDDVNACREKFSNIGLGQLSVWCNVEYDVGYCSYSNYVCFSADDVCISLYLYGSRFRVLKLELHMYLRNERSRKEGMNIYEDLINKVLAVLGIENLDRPIWVDNYDHTTNQYVTSIRHEKVLLGETWQWNIASLYCKSHEK